MFFIHRDTYNAILRHTEAGYPHEACGLLSAPYTPGTEIKTLAVTGHVPMPNSNTESPHNRYFIEPKALLKAERELDDNDQAMVGFYHSHPDHPARPSATDLKFSAGPVYWYVIVSVHQGKKRDFTAWRLSPDEKEFWPEEVIIIDP